MPNTKTPRTAVQVVRLALRHKSAEIIDAMGHVSEEEMTLLLDQETRLRLWLQEVKAKANGTWEV